VVETVGFFERHRLRQEEQSPGAPKVLLSSLADSLSRLTVYVCLLSAGFAPLWVVVAVFYCDTIVTYLGVAAVHETSAAAIGADPLPKLAVNQVHAFTHALVVWAVLWLVLRADPRDPFTIDAARRTCTVLVAAAGGVSIWWAIDRVMRNVGVLRGLLRPKS